MISKIDKNQERKRRHLRVRNKVSGTAAAPRLCVYRSLNHIYAQIIDDTVGNTLVAASTLDKAIKADLAGKTKSEEAKLVGELLAKKAHENRNGRVRSRRIPLYRTRGEPRGRRERGRPEVLTSGRKKSERNR